MEKQCQLLKESRMLRLLVFIFVGILLTQLFAGCSPSNKGERLANKFSKALGQYDGFESLSQYVDARNNAFASIKNEFDKFVTKNSTDTANLNAFYRSYNQKVSELTFEFDSAMENCIRTKLENQGWYREKDPNKYFLYSLSNDSLNVMRFKNEVAYRLHQDTLYFADKDSTVVVISFPDDTLLRLTNAKDENSFSEYRKAEIGDMVIGTWDYYMYGKYSWITYGENGRYNGQEWQNLYDDGYIYYIKTRGSYKFTKINDTTYNFVCDGGKNGVSSKVIMKDVDKIKAHSHTYTRNKKKGDYDLSILFKKNE